MRIGIRHLAAVAALAGFMALSAGPGSARTLKFMAQESDFGTVTAENFSKMVTQIVEIIGRKLNIKIEVQLTTDEQDIFDAMKEGELDLAVGVNYAVGINQGVPIEPWAVLAVDGKVGYSYCLWVAADSGIESVGDLEGGRISFIPNLALRKMLHDAGFDKPIDEFFSSATLYKQPMEALRGVLDGELDVFSIDDNSMRFLAVDDTLRNSIRKLECGPTVAPHQFYVNANLEPEIKEKLDFIVVNAHRDPDFNPFKFVFLAVKGQMKLVTAEDFQPNLDLYNEAEEKGWLEEANRYNRELLELEAE